MAISETTKQVVKDHKEQLKTRWQTLKGERDEHLATAQVLQARMDSLKAQSDALNADIPEPVQAPP